MGGAEKKKEKEILEASDRKETRAGNWKKN